MSTKLLIVILRGSVHDALLRRMLDARFRVTELSSTGGFFRRQGSTLLIGLPQERVEEALTLIRETCPTPPDADEHSATIFVLDAEQILSI